MTMPRKNAANTRRGRPLAPGNPGKPKGARHRTTIAVEALLGGEAENLTRKAIETALGGDVAAIRLCMDRIAPAPKGRRVALDLPAIASAADVLRALGAVLAAVGAGELTPDEGAAVAGLLEMKRKTIELVEIEQRIAKLESSSTSTTRTSP